MSGELSLAGRLARPVLGHLLRWRLGGVDLRAALRTCGRLQHEGQLVTTGYWNDAGDTPAVVHAECVRALDALAKVRGDPYLSVKFPSLGSALSRTLLDEAAAAGVALHADSLAPESADEIHTFLEAAAATYSNLGVTLPGRWRRSVADAHWVAELGLRARVVKGEWADPEAPEVDPREGYLAVIEALAGRARFVAVATHDAPLLSKALACLREAGTPCGVELLHGLPDRRCRRVARRAGVATRTYVPWGEAIVPHGVEFILARRAYLVPWFLRDVLTP